MAELKDVKVIDMIDGEVTKITHDGAEYVKLADKTENKKGDIALVVDGWGSQRVGEYYRLNNEGHSLWSNDSDEFVHIDGKTRTASAFLYRVEIFRKVTPVTLTLDSRVTKLEQDVAELKSDEADRVDEAETAEIKAQQAQAPRLKVGDYAKVVCDKYHDAEIDDIVKIVIDEKDHQPYRCELLNGEYAGWFRESQLEKATEEEVAEAEREKAEREAQAEEVVRWAKIGRKPNEYKPGDIVEVVYSPNASPKGTFVEVVKVDSECIYALGYSKILRKITDYAYVWTDLKLITSVDDRFDKQ